MSQIAFRLVPSVIGVLLLVLARSGSAQINQSPESILTDKIVHSAVRLTQVQNIGLMACNSSGQSFVNFSAPTFNEELVHATRSGLHSIMIEGLVQSRVENVSPELEYWLAKIRLSNGSVTLKDVTPNQGVVTVVVDWILSEYAKDLVAAVTRALGGGVALIYGAVADEYVSAGIRRYDALVEFVRAPDDVGRRGVIQRVALTCAR
jgi:hypothetical protein